MKVLSEIRFRSRYILGPVLGTCLFFYFFYHAIQGDRGLIAFWQLTKQVNQAEDVLKRVSTSELAIQHRVSLLNPHTVNRDMLEERARLMLGYSIEGEIIVFRQ
jgi:cell division protein FtsB